LQIHAAEAQVNIVRRMLEQHGRLLEPEEQNSGRKSASPASLERWLSRLETPTIDEGFSKSRGIHPRDPDDVELLPGRSDPHQAHPIVCWCRKLTRSTSS